MLVHPSVREIVEDHADLNGVLFDSEEARGMGGFIGLVRKIREERFDVVAMLHPTLRLAVAVVFAGIPIRIGTGYRLYSVFFNRRVWEHRKDARRHEAEYNLSLAAVLGVDVSRVDFHFPVSDVAVGRVEEWLKSAGIDGDRPLVLLHPGSRGSALEWPVGRFSLLADGLNEYAHAQVVVTGGKGEERVAEEVLKNVRQRAWNGAGLFDLKEFAALLLRADLVVANSTGPLHMAVTVGTDVIGLFPPITAMSPRRWGPYGREDSVLMPNVPEGGRCTGVKCPNWNCMEMISVEDVLQVARKKLKDKGFS